MQWKPLTVDEEIAYVRDDVDTNIVDDFESSITCVCYCKDEILIWSADNPNKTRLSTWIEHKATCRNMQYVVMFVFFLIMPYRVRRSILRQQLYYLSSPVPGQR